MLYVTTRGYLQLPVPRQIRTLRRARSIQPKFPEISVQNSMERFGPTRKVSKNRSTFWGWPSLLLRRFVFRMAEASAKREWLVMNRKGPWEGYRQQAKLRRSLLSPSRLPLRAHFHQKRDVWVRGRGWPLFPVGPVGILVECPRPSFLNLASLDIAILEIWLASIFYFVIVVYESLHPCSPNMVSVCFT